MQRVLLFLKGACMGIADIIPGVSGGTMALILGIYAELVNTIKGLHLRWLPAVWQWVKGGFRREDFQPVVQAWKSMNLTFLVVLGVGILSAIAAGGMVLPGLLEQHPEAMRALFFGLIVASVWIPFQMLPSRKEASRGVVVATLIIGLVAGWMATAPERMYEVGIQYTQLEAQEGDTLEDLSRRGPAAWPAEQIYWADVNEPLRDAVEQARPELELEQPDDEAMENPNAVEQRSEAYEDIVIPEGTPVQLPQPAWWYIFLAGLIGISAMILPGISGAYILLILGAYFFILNALRGTITGLTELTLFPTPIFFVAVFAAGALIGILSFARVMSYLLREFPAATVGLLVGLMVGCLRGIWPFQAMVDGQMANVMPAQLDATVMAAIAAAVAGMVLVAVLSWLGRSKPKGADDEAVAES